MKQCAHMIDQKRGMSKTCCIVLAAAFFLSLLSSESNSQPERIQFHHLKSDMGLSQSSVQCIVQDSIGFLWFGTEDGLNRYDGYQFTVYRNDPADSFSISDNYIWRLLKSRNGDLWIGTLKGGLNRYVISTGKFIAYRNRPEDSTSLSNDNVTGLFEDKSGTLWVGTWGGGLCRLDPGARGFVRYRHVLENSNSLSGNFISSIKEDAVGDLWVGTWNGLTRIDRTRTRFTRYMHVPDDPASLSNNLIWDLYVDRNDDVWLATRGGLNHFERASSTFKHYVHDPHVQGSLSSNLVASLLEDRKGNLWIGTYEKGVCVLDRSTHVFVRYAQGINPQDGPIRNDVLAMYEDRSGIIWFGTMGGISSYDPHADKFHLYAATPDDPRGLNNVRSICQSRKGGVLVGMNDGGVKRIDRQGHVLERWRADEKDPRSLSSNKVLSVLEQRDGTLWVGTQGRGLNRLSSHHRGFERYENNPQIPQSLSDNTVIALMEDREGTLWAGTNGGGLNRFDPARKAFIRYQYSPRPGSLSGDWIWSLYEDRKGSLWVGTWTRGLNRLDRTTGRFEVFVNDPADPNSLSNNSILCIREDTDGMLWIGTHGGGLNRFDPATNTFKRYTGKDGLPNDVVLGLSPDDRGNLWLGTNRGLSRFTPATGTFRNFDVYDGLQGNEFDHGAYCRLNDGTMLFGGVGGLNMFHPDSIRDNGFVPPVVITGFSVFETPVVLPQPIYNADRITLSFKENFFSFTFVALNYSSSNKNQYIYKLEGLEEEWVKAGTRRVAYYTHVPPGAYVFRVSGSNNDGVWNNLGASISVVVTPPFWGTLWFRALSSMALVSGFVLFYRRRVHGLEKEKRMQQEFSMRLMESQENERKRIAGELHDSLGQDLLVVRNRALLGLKDPSLNGNVRDQLDQISSVATQAINNVREISYDLRPYQLDRLGLTKAISSLASVVTDSSSIRFLMEVDPIDDEIGKGRAIHVYRIVQEGINNILKHADASEASVLVRQEGHDIRIAISDNGKGTRSEARGERDGRHGFGLIGITERAHAMNGTVSMESIPGKGTTLTIVIPREKKSA